MEVIWMSMAKQMMLKKMMKKKEEEKEGMESLSEEAHPHGENQKWC